MPRRSNFDIGFRPGTYWKGTSARSLPGSTDAAVEIARIRFKHGDLKLVKIIAQQSESGICYQIGKDSAQPYDATPRTTPNPLSLEELIDMIEECVHPKDVRHFNCIDGAVGQMIDFIDATSTFYPELSAWHQREAQEWVDSKRLYSSVNIVVYVAVAVATVISIAGLETFTPGKTDMLVLAYFGLSVLSLVWATNRKYGLVQVLRWLTVGVFAFIVSLGLSLPQCAWLMAGGTSLYLIAGLGVDLRTEAYKPAKHYRFSSIAHPNWQAESCVLLLFSTAYLHSSGLLQTVFWVPVTMFAAILMLLSRSRTCFWASVAAALVWTALEIYLSIQPTGWLMLLAVILAAPATMFYFNAGGPGESQSPDTHGKLSGWRQYISDIAHLDRDPLVRKNFGGRSELWLFVLRAIRQKPLLGYGHGVFWTPERSRETIRILGWSPGSSHSVYLDNLLNAGPTGLVLLLIVLASAARHVFEIQTPDALLLGSFTFFVLVHGLFESTYSTPNFRCFSFFLVVCTIT